MDKKAQIALEYLMLFFIFIILLSVISVPLLIESMKATDDMTKAVQTKSFLTELEKNVKLIYSLDTGSKRTFSIYVPCDLRLNSNFSTYNLRTTLTLSDNTKKTISVNMPCKISFNGNINYYYVNLKKRWYYNTEMKWYTSSNGERSININFK